VHQTKKRQGRSRTALVAFRLSPRGRGVWHDGGMKRSEGEVVVITGASAGVGRATVREFARRKARIGLLARGIDGLEAAKREVEEAGGKALVVPTDVGHADQVEAAAERVEQELGPIDVWVNNAMNSVFSPVKKMTADEYRRVTEVTYLGSVYGTLSALKRMLPRDGGAIVFVGSALAYRGIPLQSAYCGAKHAMQGFYDSLRTELMHDKSKVRLTMVQLPALNTPQFGWVKTRLRGEPQPMGKIFQPEVAARAIYWAAHNNRRELFVGFPTVHAIMGNKVAPWYADQVLAEEGVEGQQQEEPVEPDRPHNLWQPLPGDHGAHGAFDDQAHRHSPQAWASMHRGMLAMIGAGLVGALVGSGVVGRNGR
jgi:NAD(P)-dependent dehydrogenase (short-subunit alcohol dehydrogenase family)